jgi:hypothetical protein
MSGTPTPTLAATLRGLADNLQALANLVGDHNPPLANALLRNTILLGFAQRRAEHLEAELATARRTLRELHHQAQEEADMAEAEARAADPQRAERQHRYARIIAGLLPDGATPPPNPCHLRDRR